MSTYKSTKEIAATIRENLKRELPAWKFSVRIQTYSGGSSIYLSLMSGPLPVMLESDRITEQRESYAQLNQYTFLSKFGYGREQLESNSYPLTAAGFDVMDKAVHILAAEHWDKSDIQSDYFCTNFYMHPEIGRWDKPFQVVNK